MSEPLLPALQQAYYEVGCVVNLIQEAWRAHAAFVEAHGDGDPMNDLEWKMRNLKLALEPFLAGQDGY